MIKNKPRLMLLTGAYQLRLGGEEEGRDASIPAPLTPLPQGMGRLHFCLQQDERDIERSTRLQGLEAKWEILS